MKIRKNAESRNSFPNRVIQSGFWSITLKFVQNGFSFVKIIILARILAPDDFGIMGIALFSMVALETFFGTGFYGALIQKKEDISSYLDSAWMALILRDIFLFSLLFLIAPYLANFFKVIEAISILILC